MKVIHKYPLVFDSGGVAEISAPVGKLLKVAVRDDLVCAWFLHESDAPKAAFRSWKFLTLMTGEEVKGTGRWSYVDTVFKDWLVIHVFVEKESQP